MYNDQYVNICIMINMYIRVWFIQYIQSCSCRSTCIVGFPLKSKITISDYLPQLLHWKSYSHLCRWRAETLGSMFEGFLWDSWHTANPSIANLKISQVENEVHGNFKWQIAFSWEKILWTQRFFHRWLSHPSDAHLALMFSISSIDDAAVSAQAPV